MSGQIVGAAIKVHRTLGPGLLESAYEACLAHELMKQGLKVATQISLPVIYHGRRLGLLINFNVLRLRDGIRRMLNGY